jgi:hypothetical protein
MSATERVAEETLNSRRLTGAEFEVRVPVAVAFWRGEELGFVFSLRRDRDGRFHGLTTDCTREPGGAWSAMGATFAAVGIFQDAPERPPESDGFEIFGVHGSSFHLAFPGIAAPGVPDITVASDTASATFPVFEPLGFFLAVVPYPAQGSELRLSGRPGTEPWVYQPLGLW